MLIPVIMLTALRSHQDRVRGIEAGADDFISKPFDRDELLAKIRSLLRQKKHRDEHEKKLKDQLQSTMKDLEQARMDLARAEERIEMLERAKNQLSKFVPLSVSRLAESDPETLGLQKVETDATVLFLDIGGYSSMCESLDDERVNFLVEKYLSELTFKVRGTLDSATGPGGRDGYIHIDDARELLRMTDAEVSEIAVRLKDPQRMQQTSERLQSALEEVKNKMGPRALELHTWERLSPFANIAKMIDVLTLAIKIMLISIVLVAVMNVMIMAVYERIREIGAIAAIGTPPSRILGMFLAEGLMLGTAGTFIGVVLSLAAVYALNIWKITYNFGQQQGLLLAPSLSASDVIVTAAIVLRIAPCDPE